MSVRDHIKFYYLATITSYSQLFFSKNKYLGILVLVASFTNLFIGISGLCTVLTINLLAQLFTLDKEDIKSGLIGFTGVLTGTGLGAFFAFNTFYPILLFSTALLSLFIFLICKGFLLKYQLPFLSLPFLLTFWILQLAWPSVHAIELNDTGTSFTVPYTGEFNTQIDLLLSDTFILVFFKSIGSILFQPHALSGFLVSLGLLLASRISFLMSLIGFAFSYVFYTLSGINIEGLEKLFNGTNYIFLAIGIGSYFLVPNLFAFISVIILIPVTVLLHYSMEELLVPFGLQPYSLAFSITSLFFLYFLQWRKSTNHPAIVTEQLENPEANLRNYRISKSAFRYLNYLPVSLPFNGKWFVSQGYFGKHTHLAGWAHALDFILLDEELKPASGQMARLEEYYCYNKPVLSPVNGFVSEVINHIEDNPLGITNTHENWGNSILIDAGKNVFFQLSHLKAGSIKVKPGEYIHAGDTIGYLGNSGRSAEPHLHLQVQTVPIVGAQTKAYPVSFFIAEKDGNSEIKEYSVPEEGTSVYVPVRLHFAKKLLKTEPGSFIEWNWGNDIEKWYVYTDAYNRMYLENEHGKAWIKNDGIFFRVLDYKGKSDSLMYHFAIAFRKIFPGQLSGHSFSEHFASYTGASGLIKPISDLCSPFFETSPCVSKISYPQNDGTDFTSSLKVEIQFSEKSFGILSKTYNYSLLFKNDMTLEFKGPHGIATRKEL